MSYCQECGHALELRPFPEEGDIPWCNGCSAFRFPVFSTAVSAAVLNPSRSRVLLVQQANREDFILLAGYVKKGEDAETTLIREVKEEVGMTITAYEYMRSRYFERTNTLMLNFLAVSDSEDIGPLNYEIAEGRWFSFDDAVSAIKEGSLAKRFLLAIIEKLRRETAS